MECPGRRVRGVVSWPVCPWGRGHCVVSRTVRPWGRMRGGVSGNGVPGPPCPVALGPGGSARWRRTQVRPRFGVPRFAPSPSATSGFPVTEVTRGGRAARPVRRAWRVFLDGRRVACDASRGVAEEPLPPPLPTARLRRPRRPPDARSQPRAGETRDVSVTRPGSVLALAASDGASGRQLASVSSSNTEGVVPRTQACLSS